jgi:small subunit ribosomal protein S2
MEEETNLLIPTDGYLKSGIHIGTKFKNKYMRNFIYKTRSDGLSVLNLDKIDQRIGLASKFLAEYEPKDVMIVSRRENGWKPVSMFGKATGCLVYPGRYPPGILTNPSLNNFVEVKVLLAIDPWPDRNAIIDANKIGIPVIALCDTNNTPNKIDFVVPCNNKGKKSLGLIFWILAREYLKLRHIIKSDAEFKYTIDDFTPE